MLWAVPSAGTAPFIVSAAPQISSRATLPRPARLRVERERGLLLDVWLNGKGPYVFAIDTGAGVSIVSRNVVDRARLQMTKSRRPLVGGLTSTPISSDQETQISGIALGTRDNRVPGGFAAAVVNSLPGSIDGVLDPTEVFKPFGYAVDLPNHELQVLDSSYRLRVTDVPRDGAVVRWVGANRPFVRLNDGRLALLDTGSRLGLALSGGRVVRGDTIHDLGGGTIQSRRIEPQTVSIGALVLNKVPTDLLTGVAPGTPVIIGRGALFPFKITFDPASRLIAFEPTE